MFDHRKYKLFVFAVVFCYGNEENGHHACMNGYLTTANQSEIRKSYLVSVRGKWPNAIPKMKKMKKISKKEIDNMVR